MTGFGFGKDARIASGADFERAVLGGKKVVGRGVILWIKRSPGTASPRLGASVGRKLGGAVRRNRLKRLTREAFRLNRHRIAQGYDLVLHPRPDCAWTGLGDAEEALLDLCRKAGILRDTR